MTTKSQPTEKPRLPFFMVTTPSGQKFSMGCLGISPDSPGIPGKDQYLVDKLTKLFRLDDYLNRYLFYSQSDNTGKIEYFDSVEMHKHFPPGSNYDDPKDRIHPISGDAIVLSHKALVDSNRVYIPIGRTRDCLMMSGCTHQGDTFVLHGSIQNLWGYKNKGFVASILDHLFKIIDPEATIVNLWTGIGGSQDNCLCYEFTENPTTKQLDGTELQNCISAVCPELDLDKFQEKDPVNRKVRFAYGRLLVEVLKSKGVRRLITDHHYCSFCHGGYHSSRRQRADTANPLLFEAGIGNIAWVAPYP